VNEFEYDLDLTPRCLELLCREVDFRFLRGTDRSVCSDPCVPPSGSGKGGSFEGIPPSESIIDVLNLQIIKLNSRIFT
jgi:hypothetical protein